MCRTQMYRYEFRPSVVLEDVESALVLAIFAAENLHGEAAVRLDAAHYLDNAKRVCVIDANTAVGRDLNRLFFVPPSICHCIRLLRREK